MALSSLVTLNTIKISVIHLNFLLEWKYSMLALSNIVTTNHMRLLSTLKVLVHVASGYWTEQYRSTRWLPIYYSTSCMCLPTWDFQLEISNIHLKFCMSKTQLNTLKWSRSILPVGHNANLGLILYSSHSLIPQSISGLWRLCTTFSDITRVCITIVFQ